MTDLPSIGAGPFSDDDLAAIARLHVEQIGGGFLSSLGPRLLRLIFATMATTPECVLLAARESGSGRIVGFVSGATSAGALYRSFLRRHTLRATLLVAPRVLAPRRLRRALETLFYPRRNDHRLELPPAELMDIAVLPEFAGSGLAQRLFHAFAVRLHGWGVGEFRVGTGATLSRAQRFYERIGARRAGEVEIHRGERSVYYVWPTARSVEAVNPSSGPG